MSSVFGGTDVPGFFTGSGGEGGLELHGQRKESQLFHLLLLWPTQNAEQVLSGNVASGARSEGADLVSGVALVVRGLGLWYRLFVVQAK